MPKFASLLTKIEVLAAYVHPKYTVWWLNPTASKWEAYQSGLSKSRAERLARELKYGFGARWFNSNPSTQVQPDGEPIR